MDTLKAILAWALAHPELSVAVLGSVFSLALSLMQRAIAASPRVAAAYALLCRLFPDLSDPKALAADVMVLLTGAPQKQGVGPKALSRISKMVPPAMIGALVLVLPGCTPAFRKNAKTVLDDAALACVFAQPLESESAAIATACGIEQALLPFLDQLLAHRKATAAAASKAAIGSCK